MDTREFWNIVSRTEVVNIKGTGGLTCPCGGWLRHWENFGGQPVPGECPVVGCGETELIGAHVRHADGKDKKRYIVPLCKSCNAVEDALLTVEGVVLVSADKSQTCEKLES
jgi:hypothetical protein